MNSLISSGGSCRSETTLITASPVRMNHRVMRRADVAEVPRVDDDLDVFVLRRDLPQNRHRAVLGGIIDEDVFVTIAADFREDFFDLLVAFADVFLLVVTGADNADELVPRPALMPEVREERCRRRDLFQVRSFEKWRVHSYQIRISNFATVLATYPHHVPGGGLAAPRILRDGSLRGRYHLRSGTYGREINRRSVE